MERKRRHSVGKTSQSAVTVIVAGFGNRVLYITVRDSEEQWTVVRANNRT